MLNQIPSKPTQLNLDLSRFFGGVNLQMDRLNHLSNYYGSRAIETLEIGRKKIKKKTANVETVFLSNYAPPVQLDLDLSVFFSDAAEHISTFTDADDNQAHEDIETIEVGSKNNIEDEAEIETFAISTHGYIKLALETLKIAAKDIEEGVKHPKNEIKKSNMDNAIQWLKNEIQSVFPFSDCVQLLEYGLKIQSVGNFDVPDMQENSHVLSTWLIDKPSEAYHYLKNYETLFDSTKNLKRNEGYYEDLSQSTQQYWDSPKG